jgi:hypothetical protein
VCGSPQVRDALGLGARRASAAQVAFATASRMRKDTQLVRADF